MTWTDDDYSEFAEALDDACREWIAKGGRIYTPDGSDDCKCPLGTVVPGKRFPGPRIAAAELDVDPRITAGFADGFDDAPDRYWYADPRAYALGQQFRAKYVEGVE